MKEKVAKKCGDEFVLKGREPWQMGWYEFAQCLVQGKTVLDVGCGAGEGLKLLATKAEKAIGIDLDERLKTEHIRIMDISEMPSKSFDVVVCIDVIEHVENDTDFAKHLARVARETLFVSTPNYTISRNRNPYHVREYLPHDFERIFSRFGNCTMFGGNCTGEIRSAIKNKPVYYFLNTLYSFRATVLLAKVLKRILFTTIWAHTALIVRIS
ncbi:MAG: methyltransferase domain-containing protein [Candidatus Pacebacteria bacterium]|nr:methyltransferase domain-containing protein [Candidatus Paceibacterota bacterium]